VGCRWAPRLHWVVMEHLERSTRGPGEGVGAMLDLLAGFVVLHMLGPPLLLMAERDLALRGGDRWRHAAPGADQLPLPLDQPPGYRGLSGASRCGAPVSSHLLHGLRRPDTGHLQATVPGSRERALVLARALSGLVL